MKTLNPAKVILLEPTLEFIRALEVYNAEAQISRPTRHGLVEVQMIRYEESAEMYRHMTTIEQEKRGFQRLSELKKQIRDLE